MRQSKPAWRPMRMDDIAAVTAISDAVHGAYTEQPDVFAARLALYPAGCFMLDAADGSPEGSAPLGYLIAHPWHGGAPPALNAVLEALPIPAETICLHDIALLPEARGTGAGASALTLTEALAHAEGLPDITLIAVNGADSYWRHQGFAAVAPDAYGPGTYLMKRSVTR